MSLVDALNCRPRVVRGRFFLRSATPNNIHGKLETSKTSEQCVPFLDPIKRWAKALKRDVVALWIAGRDRRTPWHAKVAAGAVAAYALSPIDLIPDFIPILGYLDDLLIVPLGIVLVVKLIPAPLMAEFRAEAVKRDKPVSRGGLAFIVVIWLASLLLIGWWAWSRLKL